MWLNNKHLIVVINDSIRGVVSNEETFWSFLEKELPECVGISLNSLDVPLEKKINELNPDLIIQNSNLGKISNYRTISFLQDPLIEMQKHFDSLQLRIKSKIKNRETFGNRIKKQINSLENSSKVTNSNYMANLYKKFGNFDVIPMGVNEKLFSPQNKTDLRKKYNLPLDRKVKIFVGSQHPVKGFDKVKKMIQDEPAVFWILVFKDSKIPNGHNFVCYEKVSQNTLSELFNCADQCVSRSITESFGLALVEAMFCNISIDTPKVGIFWDWDPDLENPRKSAIDYKLDMTTWMNNWKEFVQKVIKT